MRYARTFYLNLMLSICDSPFIIPVILDLTEINNELNMFKIIFYANLVMHTFAFYY